MKTRVLQLTEFDMPREGVTSHKETRIVTRRLHADTRRAAGLTSELSRRRRGAHFGRLNLRLKTPPAATATSCTSQGSQRPSSCTECTPLGSLLTLRRRHRARKH